MCGIEPLIDGWSHFYQFFTTLKLEEDKMVDTHDSPQALDWFTKLVFFQADLIYNCMLSLLSPFLALFSLATDSYHKAEVAKESVESVVQKVPTNLALFIKRIGLGFLGAAYLCMVLIFLMLFAVIVGVGSVRMWVEEPVFVRGKLYFDYTQAYPEAVFGFPGVPARHTFRVYLQLLMPESHYNRHLGVFQVTAQLLSVDGQVMAKSSHPCMLHFRSLPVRLSRTFILAIPILLGISSETQVISIEMLRHKEDKYRRTGSVRVNLIPRAATWSLPQIYEAEIQMSSQLPWSKQVVHDWKWTFYVWISLYTYTMMLVVLLMCWFRPLVLRTRAVDLATTVDHQEQPQEPPPTALGAEKVSELLRKSRRRRSKRKLEGFMSIHSEAEQAGESSSWASNTSRLTTRERGDKGNTVGTSATTTTVQKDIGDSESVCLS